MYISYEYYRIFYHVARCGNLTKAAEALQNSQPNLTRAIRNLEAEIGCPLFSRTNRGMILTPEGEGLYRHIKIACTEIEAGEAAVTQSRTLERGNVFLAASEGALRCLLLPVLKRYQESTPACIFASATTPRRRPSRRCTRRRQILRSSQRRLRSRRLSRRRSSKNSGGSDLRAGLFRFAWTKRRAFQAGSVSTHHARRGHDLPCVLRLCFHRAGRCFSTRHRSRHG